MEKGIIVVEMPDKCEDCPCYESFYCCCNVFKQSVLKAVTSEIKPDWCPLIPMSERKGIQGDKGTVSLSDFERKRKQIGWNECVDYLEGK